MYTVTVSPKISTFKNVFNTTVYFICRFMTKSILDANTFCTFHSSHLNHQGWSLSQNYLNSKHKPYISSCKSVVMISPPVLYFT